MAKYSGSLPRGKEHLLISESPTQAGSKTESIGIDSDSVLVSLFVTSITGTIDVTVYTEVDTGQESEIISFPQINSSTANLLIRKAALSMDRVRVEAVYTGACEYSVRVRGIGAGEASVKIQGQSNASASQSNVGTSAQIVIPSTLDDRVGLVLKNNSASGTLYIGFTMAEASLGNAYPLAPGESLGMDLAAGQAIYGLSSSGTIDVRILQAGNG